MKYKKKEKNEKKINKYRILKNTNRKNQKLVVFILYHLCSKISYKAPWLLYPGCNNGNLWISYGTIHSWCMWLYHRRYKLPRPFREGQNWVTQISFIKAQLVSRSYSFSTKSSRSLLKYFATGICCFLFIYFFIFVFFSFTFFSTKATSLNKIVYLNENSLSWFFFLFIYW